ncbi:complement C1q and tumor necrosis factor-related protein 9-like [Patiria miniata]|uniref:C1q domain-containing protein n=1 Tax=Patiria miniata TaxID=46514 RepID=A0A914BNA1_PATMI|nr:complement C1q and tumor necrosis factor-related protein 9-like [Patiria miniata]
MNSAQRMKICVATVFSIALLLGNSVNLRASITGPVPSDGDGPVTQECHKSCQQPVVLGTILQGPKGDAGEPGQKGDTGHKGLVGPTGKNGVKGQKGEPGESPDDRRVAFTVETKTLLPGTNFDLETGTFTCSVPGTYVFTFSVSKYTPSSNLAVHLRKNGAIFVSGGSNESSNGEQVITVAQSDRVTAL